MARTAKDENKNLKQYATKVDPKTKATLDFITKVKGQGFGQRELLGEMLELYREKNPEVMVKVDQLVELLGGEY